MRPSERLITLKSALSSQQLHILNIELDRRRRSTGVTYFLWFFLGWLALHKFYLGRVMVGVIYLVAPWVFILLSLSGIVIAESNAEIGTAAATLGLLGLLVYGVWWLVDLFTIPRQVTTYNEDLEFEIIAALNARNETGDFPASRLGKGVTTTDF